MLFRNFLHNLNVPLLLAILISAPVLIYFVLPLTVLRKFFYSAMARLELLPPRDPLYTAEVESRIQRSVETLVALGFERRGLFKLEKLYPNVYSITALLTHAESKTMATVSAVMPEHHIIGHLPVMGIGFQHLLSDGKRIELLNVGTRTRMPVRAGHIVAYLPSLQDPTLLFRAFCRLSSGISPEVERSDREFADPRVAFNQDLADQLEHWSTTGHFHFSSDRRQLRYTLKGAYLAAWSFLPPFKGILASRDRKEEQALLRKLFSEEQSMGSEMRR